GGRGVRARGVRHVEDCSGKTGMLRYLGRRSVLLAAGSARAASLAPLPTPARAAERKAPAGAVWRESPNDPTKVPGTPTAEDGGYGSRSQFATELRWRYPTPTTLSSWTMTPLHTSEGIITPSRLHLQRHPDDRSRPAFPVRAWLGRAVEEVHDGRHQTFPVGLAAAFHRMLRQRAHRMAQAHVEDRSGHPRPAQHLGMDGGAILDIGARG